MPFQSVVAQVFAAEWPILVATLRRDLGDLGLAEEAAQEAFAEAAARWGPTTTPDRPGAWLLTTARRKAIDQLRRDQRFADRLPALLELSTTPPRPSTELIDDQLALIFGCCHDSLNAEAQIALTLREVCGLSTAQIAESFLVSSTTMGKRLVRAKTKIRAANVPFVVPEPEELPDRLGSVLHVIYLIFTAGHTASEGQTLVRGDLCDEARWLADIVGRLLRDRRLVAGGDGTTGGGTDGADEPEGSRVGLAEVLGLQALLAFTDARRATRIDDDGQLVLLEDQERSRWDTDLVAEGQEVLSEAVEMGSLGPYQLQAAIAGLHAGASSWDDTDWRAIVWLYDRLVRLVPTPVVALNRAVAVAMLRGPEAGILMVDDLAEQGELEEYRYLHTTRADLLRRLGRVDEAVEAYRRALDLGGNEAEQGFIRRRLAELDGAEPTGS